LVKTCTARAPLEREELASLEIVDNRTEIRDFSDSVLSALARAVNLDEAERAHGAWGLNYVHVDRLVWW
jgi:hypothetical protein